MQLCVACSAIRIEQLPDPSETGFRHLPARNLLTSAQTCPLCSLIKSSFHKVDLFTRPHDLVERDLRSYGELPLRLYAIRQDGARTSSGGANITSIEVAIREKSFRGRFDVYTSLSRPVDSVRLSCVSLIDAASPIKQAGDVARIVHTRVTDGGEVTELLRSWLQNCVSTHAACHTTLTDDGIDENRPSLPDRLIAVGSDGMAPRLIQTKSLTCVSPRVRYASLSHCWGSHNRRPLRTTEATFVHHLRSIPLENMPQTFKEAILICRNLAVPYLWIDSLCIIQDNEEDWRRQSSTMGLIYEGAVFTIAASSAIDSSQGLFLDNFTIEGVEIPYYDRSKIKVGSVVAYLRHDFQSIINTSPLSQRAWVMQEYMLSRRMLHFTSNGILWSCKNGENIKQRWFQSEHGDEWIVVDDFPVWKWLVTSYSKRELTFKSDKLMAVQGLANKFGKRIRSIKNEYAYGLWLDDLPEDLFWHGENALCRDVGSNIPSWSWASMTGEIYFKSIDEPQRACRKITLDAEKPGQLKIESRIKEVGTVRGPMACQAFSIENLQRMDFDGELHDEYRSNNLRVAPTYLLLDGSQKIGWCVFDEFERPPGRIWCLSLLKQAVWAWFRSAEELFDWVLVLQYSDSDEAFVRVGWGLILRTSWFDDVVEQIVDLL